MPQRICITLNDPVVQSWARYAATTQPRGYVSSTVRYVLEYYAKNNSFPSIARIVPYEDLSECPKSINFYYTNNKVIMDMLDGYRKNGIPASDAIRFILRKSIEVTSYNEYMFMLGTEDLQPKKSFEDLLLETTKKMAEQSSEPSLTGTRKRPKKNADKEVSKDTSAEEMKTSVGAVQSSVPFISAGEDESESAAASIERNLPEASPVVESSVKEEKKSGHRRPRIAME